MFELDTIWTYAIEVQTCSVAASTAFYYRAMLRWARLFCQQS